ncbi:MAG TPA: hypothetical protein VMW32_10055 [Bacteroidales bacterium]|nr:hypothetical protein [Bacteroidales bacterium]
MKRSSLILVAFFLISFSSSFQPAGGQERSSEEKERELRIKEEFDLQKKALADQKKAAEEQKKAQEAFENTIVIQRKALDKALEEAGDQVEAATKFNEAIRMYRGTGDRSFYFEPFDIRSFSGHSMYGDSERTTWDFSKSIKENSFSRDYSFDVEKSVKTVVMAVNGDCKSGEIRIKIIMPNGKTYSDIVIDEFGNLNWRKSFNISEEENKDKAGEWKFQINASKATGVFKISLQTY